jgi:hypothetical protein
MGNNHVFEGERLKLLQGTTIFSWKKEFLLLKHMIFPWEKKVYVVPQGNLIILLPKDMIVPWGKAQVPQGNICSKTFCNHSHLIYALYKHVTYHWKGFQGEPQLCS